MLTRDPLAEFDLSLPTVAQHYDRYTKLSDDLQQDILTIQAHLSLRQGQDEDGIPLYGPDRRAWEQWRRKAVAALQVKTKQRLALKRVLHEAKGVASALKKDTDTHSGSPPEGEHLQALMISLLGRSRSLRGSLATYHTTVDGDGDFDDLLECIEENLTELGEHLTARIVGG